MAMSFGNIPKPEKGKSVFKEQGRPFKGDDNEVKKDERHN